MYDRSDGDGEEASKSEESAAMPTVSHIDVLGTGELAAIFGFLPLKDTIRSRVFAGVRRWKAAAALERI